MSSDVVLPYAEFCQQVKPGDVIAFSSIDVPSRVVKLATHSRYVHVAIALSVDPTTHTDYAVLIAESHVDGRLPSVLSQKRGLGVQIQWLSKRLASYRGWAWWAALKQPLLPTQIGQLQAWAKQVETQRIGYDFVQAVEAGIEAFTHVHLPNPADESQLFCSELVTCGLQRAGVIDSSINAATQTPAHIMAYDCLQSPILIKNDLH
jgi:hypothetical protein